MILGLKFTVPIIIAYIVELLLSSGQYTPTQFFDLVPVLLGVTFALLGLTVCMRMNLDREKMLGVVMSCTAVGTLLGFLRKKKKNTIKKNNLRNCSVKAFKSFSPPSRSNREKYLAAKKACEAHTCTSDDCCADVLALDYNSTSRIYHSLFERDCLLLLAEKCSQKTSNKLRYTNKVMEYLATLGDGSPCPSSLQCSKNQLKSFSKH